MLVINKSQCSLNGNTLVTEASTIELKPGEWPDFISVVNDRNQGFMFGPEKKVDMDDGDVIGMRYQSRYADCDLLVIND